MQSRWYTAPTDLKMCTVFATRRMREQLAPSGLYYCVVFPFHQLLICVKKVVVCVWTDSIRNEWYSPDHHLQIFHILRKFSLDSYRPQNLENHNNIMAVAYAIGRQAVDFGLLRWNTVAMRWTTCFKQPSTPNKLGSAYVLPTAVATIWTHVRRYMEVISSCPLASRNRLHTIVFISRGLFSENVNPGRPSPDWC